MTLRECLVLPIICNIYVVSYLQSLICIQLGYIHVILCQVFFFMLELQKKPVDGFSAGLVDDDDIYKWEVLIMGPPDTY